MTDPRRVGPHQLAVYDHPTDGPAGPVVFVHGSMDRGASFLKVTRRLRDLHCVRYDRRGYGRSVTAEPAGSIAEQVGDLAAVIERRPSVVVGHSLGGVIALGLAHEQPELVLALAVFEAPMGWAPWWPAGSAGNDALAVLAERGPEDAAEVFMRRMVGDEGWERLPPSTRAARRAEGRALVAEIGAMRDARPPYEPDAITAPLVVGRGSDTAPHHLRASDELAAAVGGAELVVIEGAGHGAHTSHPDEFAAFVRRAVARGMIPA